jgi:hypothetical protein
VDARRRHLFVAEGRARLGTDLPWVQLRDAAQQCLGVRVRGSCVDLVAFADLDDLAELLPILAALTARREHLSKTLGWEPVKLIAVSDRAGDSAMAHG